MKRAATQGHHLEDHILTLQKLDKIRKKSAQLRDEGVDVLVECLHPPKKDKTVDQIESIAKYTPSFGGWRYENSLVIQSLLASHDQPKNDKSRELRKDLVEQLGKNDGLSLEKLAKDELSVLTAAGILRALSAQPSTAFSKEALLCYYWIARELYTADRSDWNIGGARAAPGGLVTAYTTGECVNALLSFTEALHNTGKFIEAVGKYVLRKKELSDLKEKFNTNNNVSIYLEKWIKAEEERILLSCILNLKRFSYCRALALDLTVEGESIKFDETPSVYLNKIEAPQFKDLLKNAAKDMSRFLSEACKDIFKYRGEDTNKSNDKQGSNGSAHNEESNGKQESNEKAHKVRETLNNYINCEKLDASLNVSEKQEFRDFARSESAHLFAVLGLRNSLDRVKKAELLFADQNVSDERLYEVVTQAFYAASRDVDSLFHPVKSYLSSVLDRELELVNLGESWDWEPSELACAATAYGRLTKDWEKDPRFGRAANDLSKMISSRGRFANLSHFHEQPDNTCLILSNTVILHSMAQLLRYTHNSEVEPALADCMLRFFEDTRAHKSRNFWLFNAMDFSPKLIQSLGEAKNNEQPLQYYIRKKLSKNVQDLLGLVKEERQAEDLPKDCKEGLISELVKEFNRLLQAGPLDEAESGGGDETNPFEKEEELKQFRERLKKEIPEDEKFSFLLNRFCLQKAFPDEIRPIDVVGRAQQVSSGKKGWSWEFSRPPLKTGLMATSSAIIALAEINKMLDEHINHIILEHFSVKKKGEELNADLTLDRLFYPDYGLRLAPATEDYNEMARPDWIAEKDWPEQGIRREKSVAITLLQMRAQVLGLSIPKESEVKDSKNTPLPWSLDPLWSLILHGPAGTGKTTLIEALAVDCDVPMVEVTPSDLVKRGVENVEQRARTVFEALSMLTRVVILFDEFDPVLKRRDAAKNTSLSLFSFLTPGMLPKLKELNNQAKKRSVAYVLITNLIGELDEAAVRQGRFDERLGIYPPDFLSRTGRFLDQVKNHEGFDFDKVDWKRIIEVIQHTGGMGMTTLGKPGWFTYTKKKATESGLPMAHILDDKEEELENIEPDDTLKNIRGEGRVAVTEYLQWKCIKLWDIKFKGKVAFPQSDVLWSKEKGKPPIWDELIKKPDDDNASLPLKWWCKLELTHKL